MNIGDQSAVQHFEVRDRTNSFVNAYHSYTPLKKGLLNDWLEVIRVNIFVSVNS